MTTVTNPDRARRASARHGQPAQAPVARAFCFLMAAVLVSCPALRALDQAWEERGEKNRLSSEQIEQAVLDLSAEQSGSAAMTAWPCG